MAKAEFLVEVTDEDIMRGVRSQSAKCMVARALKRGNRDADRVMVDIQTIRYTDREKGERYVWLTPPDIQDLIVAFDGGELSRLEPVSFRLRRRDAHQIQRVVPATPEDHEQRKAATRERRSASGAKRRLDPPAGSGVVPQGKAAKRASTSRVYGMRALNVNRTRARQGDLPPEPEPIPNG